MKIKKLFILSFLAFLACGCQEEEQVTKQPATGNEVKFGATLDKNTTTRTIYGEEANNAFPIYWVNGDEVIVSSPQCAINSGVGKANYKVTVDGEQQNYATSLDKTGDIGVRWGNNLTGDFYSVYPASNAELGNDYTTATLDMPIQQDCGIVEENGVQTIRPDMDACFMYAKTTDVQSGNTVNLKYTPLSTAIRFKVFGPTSGDPVTISRITLHAPTGVSISGQFTANLATATESTLPTVTAASGSSNDVLINATKTGGGYLTLGINESVEINAFLLLEGETDITNDWNIQIVANGKTFTKSLGAISGGNTTLVPGKIHRLPDLPALNEVGDWDVSNWMTNIPRNVYLSEISIPGSWNSVNSDFQNSTDIDAQYEAGARAFHIDARWNGSYSYNIFTGAEYSISGLGVANNGGTDGPTFSSSGKVMSDRNAPTFSSILSQITDNVQPNEYMVVFVTFAQDSYDYNRSNGGWEQEVSNICADNSDVIDARTLNANSVVGDVLGKVIVIVNTDNAVSSADSKCLFMRGMGMTLDQDTYRNTDYTETTLADGSGTTRFNAYGTHAQVSATGNGLGYGSSARGYAPSLPERETKAGNILKWSKSNYSDVANYVHDTWLYIGLGGYQVREDGDRDITGSYNTVASTLNSWINTQVTNMDTDGYYPVGIVLMNFVTNTSYRAVMNNILQLNNKYRMAYDPDRSPIDGSQITGSGSNNVQSAAPGYSSGMTDNKTNAIHW